MATLYVYYAKYFRFLWSETNFINDLTYIYYIGIEYKTIKPFYESQRIYIDMTFIENRTQ